MARSILFTSTLRLQLGAAVLVGAICISSCLPQKNDKATPRGTNEHSSNACRSSKQKDILPKIRPPGLELRNGVEATADDFPSVGMLFYMADKKTSVCTATLVCSDVVMTAAHCFVGMEATGFSFHLNTAALPEGKSIPDDRAGAPKGVRSVIRDSRALEASVATGSDIALLKLDQRLAASTSTLNLDRLSEDEVRKNKIPLTLVGYGHNAGMTTASQTGSGIKRYGQMRLVAHEAADTDPSKLLLGVLDPLTPPDKGVKSCHGDSGGPAFLNNEVYGVIAVSDKSCQSGTLTAVSLVSENQAWLRKNLAEMCGNDKPKFISNSIDTSSSPARVIESSDDGSTYDNCD